MIIGFSFTACPEMEPEPELPALFGTVSINGITAVGQTLTASTVSLGGNGAISYKWKRGISSIGTNSSTYIVKAADLGSTITITVARAGYSGNITSQAIGPVSAAYSIPVTFTGITANGNETRTSTQLTLTFSQAITGLTADDVTLSGVSGITKGTLSGSGPTYTLPISGFTAGGDLNVAVAKSGYYVSGSTGTVTVIVAPAAGSATITLTFAQITDIPDINGPTIKLEGSPTSAIITLDNFSQYSDVNWYITGTSVTQNGGSSFTLTTDGSVYNGIGQHFLTVELKKDGIPFNKTIVFTVAP